MSQLSITVACPAAMRDDANSLAMVLGEGPGDGRTYRHLTLEDAAGNLYTWARFDARPEWVQASQSALTRPEWDVEPYRINMAGANRAQAALVFWAGTGPHPQAAPDKLVASAAVPAEQALAAMGLTKVEVEI